MEEIHCYKNIFSKTNIAAARRVYLMRYFRHSLCTIYLEERRSADTKWNNTIKTVLLVEKLQETVSLIAIALFFSGDFDLVFSVSIVYFF